MYRRLLCAAVIAAVLPFAAGVARAQPIVLYDRCLDPLVSEEAARAVISACSAVLAARNAAPESRAVFFRARASAYVYVSDSEKAVSDLTRAIGVYRRRADLYGDRALLYARLQQQDKADEDLQQVFRFAVNPAYPLVLRCQLRGFLNKQLAEALADCNQVLGLQPRNSTALLGRAVVRFRLGDFKAAATDSDAALGISPTLAAALYVRGLARSKAGDTAGGAADLAEAATARPPVAAEYADFGLKL